MAAALSYCGEWCLLSCDTKLVAVHSKDRRDPYVFDCSSAEKKPKDTKNDQNSDDCSSEDTGSDKVLAFASSPSGKLVALTDDSKRLILFRCHPSWQVVSTRFVGRRCTALVFSHAEDELMVADKSGDVYSFSVVEPKQEGELKMGHLSMLLDMTLSPDDKYIITADRDEKIRVSHRRCPYNIQSFCLGHQQFVSALHIPSANPHCLLSGSGDGSVKLWHFESGQRLQSCELGTEETENTESEADKKPPVSRIISSVDGRHVAVLCEGVLAVQFFSFDSAVKEKLVPRGGLSLPHCPLDLTFDAEGRLWVLLDSSDTPLRMYLYKHDSWECEDENSEVDRVAQAFKPHWATLEASTRTNNKFQHLVKTSYDNVEAYKQKKQQRLEEQQLKRMKTQKVQDNKKARKELSGSATQSLT